MHNSINLSDSLAFS